MSVTGLVNVSELGRTLMHEHLLVDFAAGLELSGSGHQHADDDKWMQPLTASNYYEMRWSPFEYFHAMGLRSADQAVEGLRLFTAHGGGTVVEVTPIGVGRDPEGLRSLSEVSGVTIIMGTGYLTREFHPRYLLAMTEIEIAEALVREGLEGVGPYQVRPGIIGEIGLSWPPHPRELSVLNAAVVAQRELGLAISVHPGRHPAAPLEAVRSIERADGDPTHAAIGHLDRTIFAMTDLLDLAETGVRLEFDLFGHESRRYSAQDIDLPNDGGRIATIVDLFQRGFGDRILISHDLSSPLRLTANGGEGYHHILKRVLPVMARRGLSEGDLRTLVVDNPASFLAVRDGSPMLEVAHQATGNVG
jgi:phosphotriesterase-related protein